MIKIISSSYRYSLEKIGNNLISHEYKEINIPSVLQSDYGELNDCAITSISSVIDFYNNHKSNFLDIYNSVIKNKYPTFSYNNFYGTIPIFISSILKNLASVYNIKKNANSKYLKEIGYAFETIKEIIDKNEPIILSVSSANNGYYKYHAMVIRGYIVYQSKNTKEKVRLLIVNDNWDLEKRYVDYDTIGKLSAISYLI